MTQITDMYQRKLELDAALAIDSISPEEDGERHQLIMEIAACDPRHAVDALIRVNMIFEALGLNCAGSINAVTLEILNWTDDGCLEHVEEVHPLGEEYVGILRELVASLARWTAPKAERDERVAAVTAKWNARLGVK